MTWDLIIKAEMAKQYFKDIDLFLKEDSKKNTIYPLKEDIFNAFKLCPLDKLKAVIISQDPYHGPNQAHGLAFSVKPGVAIPPSLRNIYKELSNDLDIKQPGHGCLNAWAEQGALLLNAILTVQSGKPGSHSKIGWQQFTDSIITYLSSIDKPLVYILWGAFAKSKSSLITNPKHLILTGSHPSPLSIANGGSFFGGKYFSKTNNFLSKNGVATIDWVIPEIC